jgi:hypothetical protein
MPPYRTITSNEEPIILDFIAALVGWIDPRKPNTH